MERAPGETHVAAANNGLALAVPLYIWPRNVTEAAALAGFPLAPDIGDLMRPKRQGSKVRCVEYSAPPPLGGSAGGRSAGAR